MRPLAIDLFCGLGGWTSGLLAEGFDVIGFDIERHVYGEHKYPAQLVLQDVRTIHGKQFRDAALIVASPPCQRYSYMAMPWSKSKEMIRKYEADISDLNELFDACFRIQREACEAGGRHIPMVVENVRGAQRWIGRSRWNYGSFHLWGDVPAFMPMTKVLAKRPGHDWNRFKKTGEVSPHWKVNGQDSAAGRERFDACKNQGGSWFAVSHNNVPHSRGDGVKMPEGSAAGRSAALQNYDRRAGSKSPARKFASAMIAKIPLALSRHIAAYWHPRNDSQSRAA